MPTATLLLGGLLAIGSAVLFGYVGRVVAERAPTGEARVANSLFSAWWVLLAVATAAPGILSLVAAYLPPQLFVHVAVTQATLILISAALACLLYYLIYIYTGKTRALRPVMLGYALYAFTLLLWIAYARPIAVEVGDWGAMLRYERPLEGPLSIILVLLLVGPQIVGALAYFSLVWRVRGRERRFRIVLVSLAIIVWFGTSLLGNLAGFVDSPAWEIVSRLVAFFAAASVLLAYRPPSRLRRWLTASAPDTAGGVGGAGG